MKTRSSTKLDPSAVTARLGLCAAALAGTAVSMPEVEATIITFTPPGGLVVPATIGGVYINFLTGATGGSGAAVPGWDFNPYSSGTQLSFYWAPPAVGGDPSPAGGVAGGTFGPYLDLAPGTVISGASTFSRLLVTTGSPFLTTGTHILGFYFTNESTGMVNYGYLTMKNTAGSPEGFPATILSWSFDNTGAPITVPVPEPSSVALLTMSALALGALGLRAWRRAPAA